jgi:hypothetical protein
MAQDLGALGAETLDIPVFGIAPWVEDMLGLARQRQAIGRSRTRSPPDRNSQREPSSPTAWQGSMWPCRPRETGSLHGPSMCSAWITEMSLGSDLTGM